MFVLAEEHLRQLCELNSFDYPKDGHMIFFGLRGAVPVDEGNHDFERAHKMELVGVDYLHPRCTIGQWLPAEGTISVFPGSTVPHKRHVKTAFEKAGVGANQLATGFYGDYRKGMHKAGSATGHQAFRQTDARPIRRTGDDFDYDNDDRVEFANAYDNLHAAWCMGVDSEYYASAGCQVVIGYPECAKRQQNPDAGPWKAFRRNAYQRNQDRFPYILLSGREVQRASLGESKHLTRLRFGSSGPLVEAVQRALQSGKAQRGQAENEASPLGPGSGELLQRIQAALSTAMKDPASEAGRAALQEAVDLTSKLSAEADPVEERRSFYEGKIDGDFGRRTLRAVLEFQEAMFGPSADDGIVGPTTASALGIIWPE